MKGTRIVPWLKWVEAETGRNGDGYIYVWRKLTGISAQALGTHSTENIPLGTQFRHCGCRGLGGRYPER